MIFAPLLLHSLMLDSIRLNFESEEAIAMTGDQDGLMMTVTVLIRVTKFFYLNP